MGWMTLLPHDRSEAEVQRYFNKWSNSTKSNSSDQWSHVGAPAWLEELEITHSNDQFSTVLGYGFRPDLLARSQSRDTRFVIELKCARKYEPLLGLRRRLTLMFVRISGRSLI